MILAIAVAPMLHAQGPSSTGVPIKISAQAQAGIVGPIPYYYGPYWSTWQGSSFTYSGYTFYLCTPRDPDSGGTPTWGALPDGTEICRPYFGTPPSIYPYYSVDYLTAPTSLQLSGTFMPATPTTAASATTNLVNASTSYQSLNVPLGSNGNVQVEPGRTYTLNVTQSRILSGVINISAPPQYRVVMNGIPRSSCALTSTVTFTVLPRMEGPPGAAGFASSVASSRLDWQIALGSLRNGDSAGSLRMVEAAQSASWTDFFTPGLLYYEPTSDEVFVYRVSNVIRQIIANQVALDIVDDGTDAYKILCYHPSQMSGAAPATFSGSPFVEYRIAKGGTATTLTFSKTTRNVTAPTGSVSATRVETMSLARTGTWPNYTWSKVDWTQSGQTALVTTTVTGSGTAGSGGVVSARTETASVQAPGGVAKLNVARTYAWGGAGEVLQRETLGTASGNSPWTEFSYYTDAGDPGSYGYAKTVTLATGQWEAYDYTTSNSTTAAFGGQVKTRYRPFGSTPATADLASLTSGEVTSYTYAADEYGALTRPATVETQINGTTTTKTAFTYDDTNGGANDGFVLATRKDYSNSTQFLQTVTKSYSLKGSDPFTRGKVYSVVQPGQVKQSFVYQRGTWSSGSFTASSGGTASRLATVIGSSASSAGSSCTTDNTGAALDALYLVDGKSTLAVTYRDANALVVRTESYAWKSSAWNLVGYTDFTYNFYGLLTSRVASNGATYTATYDGLLKTSETDESGVTTSFTYDAAGRVIQSTRSGSGVIGSLATRFTYDAAGNVLETKVGEVSTGQLVTTRVVDDAGRITSETPPGLGAIAHTYNVSANSHTVTNPDSGQTVETKGIDGRPLSKTGSATVAQYYTYGVESDGRQWAKTSVGTSTSTRWLKAWKDWLGREIRTERPAFTTSPAQANYVEMKTFDSSTGRLTASSTTGSADTLYSYDVLGSLFRTALDVNSNSAIDLAGADRITETEKTYEFASSAWWVKSETRQYATASSSTPTVMATSRQRLTAFPTNRLSETQATDVNGNVTTTTTDVVRSTATTTVTTATTGIPVSAIETKVAGLTTSVRSHQNLTTAFTYDALLRQTGVKDSRTFGGVNNTTTTAYASGSNLVASITDATGVIVAQNTYDTMGRLIAQAGAPDTAVSGNPRHTVYSSYNVRGQITQQWGDATTPVSYGYDSVYGQKTGISTYRGGTGWEASTWPSSPGTADTTTWTYDGPSGLLSAKTSTRPDPSAAVSPTNQPTTVNYVYNSRGQLTRRTWARGVQTDYLYDLMTAEQRDILYSDGTPSLHYNYNRLGQTTQIDDATGSRILAHCVCGKLASEHLDTDFYGHRLLTYKINSGSSTMLGRTLGYTLTDAASATEQDLTYGYDGADHLTTVATSTPGITAAAHTFNYAYLTNSNLISALSVDSGHPFTISRTFEDQRDVLASVEAKWSTTSRSKHAYTVDALGQRTSATQSGDAFADYYDGSNTATYQKFSYDAKGQVTAALNYLGNAATSGKELPDRQFEYAYDQIGNRTWSNRTGVTGDRETYTSNGLNQLTARENKTVNVSGAADATVKVAVVGKTALAPRQGRFWSDNLTVANSSAPWRGPINIFSGKAGSTSATDLVRTESRFGQVARTPQSFTYDADGNLLDDGLWTYVWDAENRLVRMTTSGAALGAGFPGRELQFRYDYLGRRVQKLVIDTATSQLLYGRRFLYDGWNLIAEYADTGATAIGSRLRSYTWGLDIARSLLDAGGVGALLQIADHASGKTFFPTYDGNGNITTLVNSSTGSLGAVYEYSPYGEPTRSQAMDSTLTDQPFRFSTKYVDLETGLYYYGRRYYDPKTGRWLGRDPKEEIGGLHLYGFVKNNPINRWDFLGMCDGADGSQQDQYSGSDGESSVEEALDGAAAEQRAATQAQIEQEERAAQQAEIDAAAAAAASRGNGLIVTDQNGNEIQRIQPPSQIGTITTGGTGGPLTVSSTGGQITTSAISSTPSSSTPPADPDHASWSAIGGMTLDWALGTAPQTQVLDANSPLTQDMMNARGVNNAIDFFYAKYSGQVTAGNSVTNYGAGFGLTGLLASGTNATRQFVGNYTVNIVANNNGTLTIQAINTTSFTSFFYGIWPNSWNFEAGLPAGKTTQIYQWTVPVRPLLATASSDGPGGHCAVP